MIQYLTIAIELQNSARQIKALHAGSLILLQWLESLKTKKLRNFTTDMLHATSNSVAILSIHLAKTNGDTQHVSIDKKNLSAISRCAYALDGHSSKKQYNP